MDREEMIIRAVEIIRSSMEYNGVSDETIRSEAEKLSNEELRAFLQEE